MLPLGMAEAFEESGFPFNERWHSFDCVTCKNGCHTIKDENGFWCHHPTLEEMIEFVHNKSSIRTMTLEYVRRALYKLEQDPFPGLFRKRMRPHGARVIPFARKSETP